MRFKGKTALITGGSRGIGKAITLKLAAEGADVIINHLRKRDAAAATAEEARKLGVKAHVIRANIAEVEKIDAMFDEIEAEFGKLDIFVSNAASGTVRAAMELDERGWDWTMNINARAFLLGAQRAARLMPKKGGSMVCISSLGAQMVLPVYTAVGVSKAALESLTRYLAVELAPRGIKVNAVSAGAVQSENLMRYGGDLPVQQITETPAGRLVLGEDIANLVAFLCSDDAAMICGQVVIIDGGMSISWTGSQKGANLEQ